MCSYNCWLCKGVTYDGGLNCVHTIVGYVSGLTFDGGLACVHTIVGYVSGLTFDGGLACVHTIVGYVRVSPSNLVLKYCLTTFSD